MPHSPAAQIDEDADVQSLRSELENVRESYRSRGPMTERKSEWSGRPAVRTVRFPRVCLPAGLVKNPGSGDLSLFQKQIEDSRRLTEGDERAVIVKGFEGAPITMDKDGEQAADRRRPVSGGAQVSAELDLNDLTIAGFGMRWKMNLI